MSPYRHEGDRKVWIEGWGSHVDQMIREAQARGEFDNLPGAGQPLRLEDNVFAAEWQAAFRIAKNAGAAPLWIELDKEIQADTAALQALLERTARRLETEAARLKRAAAGPIAGPDRTADSRGGAPDAAGAPKARWRGWWPFARDGGRRVPGPAGSAGVPRRVPGPAGSAGVPRRVPRRTPFGGWTPHDPSPAPWSPWVRWRREPAGAEPRLAQPVSLADLEAERQRARALYLAHAAELDRKIQDYNANRPRTLSWLEKPRLLPAAAGRCFDTACPPLAPDP